MSAPHDSRTPVSLVTGYLGSGKTTLISRLLVHPEMGETAVIVNELGEIGIDHHLLRRVDERTVLLNSGCVCCTLRGDLVDELRDLIDRRDAGQIPAFRRVVVETTGLADPTPIVNTLLADPMLQHQVRLDAIVATIDAQHGLRGPESVKQAATADVLVLTKTDLAPPERVTREVERLNPAGEIVIAVHGDVMPGMLFERPPHDPRAAAREARHHHPHEDDVSAVSLVWDEPLDWMGVGVWLTMLLHARGEDVLRIKGLLDVGGEGPLVINCVQHVVHPPLHLEGWPVDDRRSRLVFIGRGLGEAALRSSLAAFDLAARRARGAGAVG